MPFIVGAFTSFGTAIGLGTTAAAAFGSFAARLLLSTAISALQARWQPDAEPRGGLRFSVTQNGGTTPCSFPIGTTAIAGQNCCPPMSHGTVDDTPNAYLTKVIELSDIPGCTLKRVSIDGEWVTPGVTVHPDYGLPVLGRYEGHAWIKFYDGTQGVADPMLLAKYGDYPERPWLPDMVYTGVCYAICTFLHNPEIFRGDPVLKFELGGIPLYDPRKDSTVGGAGLQRWNNVSTWQPSDNPIVQDYNLCRGITFADGSVWGGGFDADDLPLSNLFAAMNACDQMVSNGSGGTERIYRSGYEVAVTDEPFNVREELLKAANAVPWEAGGTFKVRVGLPAAATIYITDNDLVVSAAGELRPFLAPQDVFNGITASFPDPDTVYVGKDAPARLNPAWEARDGGRELTSLSLPAVPYPRQVQRLMKSAINDHQRAITHQFTLLRRFAYIEPGDVLSWTSVENGYIAKLFEVTGVWVPPLSPHPVIAIREIDPSDYDFDADTDILPSSSPSPIKVRPGPQTVPGFAVNGITIKDASGVNRRPAIEILWFGGAHRGVRAIKYRIRLQASGDIIRRGSTADVDGGRLVIGGGILPGLAYEVSARQVAKWQTVWTDWVAVTTPDIRFGEVDLDGPLVTRIAEADRVVAEHDALVAGFNGTLVEALDDANALANAGLQGWVKDPTFRGWSGAPVNLTATNWASRSGTSAYAVMGDGDFGGGMHVTAPTGSALVDVIASTATGLTKAHATADYVVMTLHVDYIVGNSGGAFARVEWSNDGTSWTRGTALGVAANLGSFAALGLSPNPGVRQAVQVLWQRPVSVSGHMRIRLMPKSDAATDAQEMIVHLLNVGPANQAQIDAGKTYVLATATPGETTTVAGIGAAVAQLNAAMTARVGANETSIVTLETVTADTEQAVASITQTLSATANAGTAYFRDTFDGDLSMWEVNTGLGSGEVAAITSISGVGSKILRLGNNSGADTVWMAHKHLIPFDPNKTYKMTIRARRTFGAGTLYAGFMGVASDGVTLVNTVGSNSWSSQHYHAAANQALATGFSDQSGYTRGRAATGLAAVGTAENPSEVHASVAFLRPMIIANYNAVAGGIHEIAHVTVDDGSIADLPATVETQAAVISDLEGNAAAIWGVKISAGTASGKFELVAADNPTGASVTADLEVDVLLVRAGNMMLTPGNMVSNPSFIYGMTDWRPYSSTENLQSVVPASTSGVPANAPSAKVMRYSFDAAAQYINTFTGAKAYSDTGADRYIMAVTPGEEYLVTIAAAANTATGLSLFSVRLYWLLASGVFNTSALAISRADLTTAWDVYSGSAVAPAGAVGCWAYVQVQSEISTARCYWTNLTVRQKSGASLIVDGSITADKLVSGEIIAGSMIVGGAVSKTYYYHYDLQTTVSTTSSASPHGIGVGLTTVVDFEPRVGSSNPVILTMNTMLYSTGSGTINFVLQRSVSGSWVTHDTIAQFQFSSGYSYPMKRYVDASFFGSTIPDGTYRIAAYLSSGSANCSVGQLLVTFQQVNK